MIKQRHVSRYARQEALKWLIARFPKAFCTDSSIHALQLGMMDEVLKYADEAKQQGISKSKLREALVMFTRRLDYLACLKAQGERINLDGKVVGVVSAEEAEQAALKIKKRIEKYQKHQRFSRVNSSNFLTFPDHDITLAPMELQKPQKAVEVVIKTKSSKSIDPSAVSRLRSKLGLPTD